MWNKFLDDLVKKEALYQKAPDMDGSIAWNQVTYHLINFLSAGLFFIAIDDFDSEWIVEEIFDFSYSEA